MLGDKTKTVSGSNWEVWLSGRGTSTDESKPCALPLSGDLAAATGNVAKNATATAIAATWIPVGAVRDKSIKLSGKALTDMMAGGLPLQTGLDHLLEVEGLETDATKTAAVEALLDDTAVDIIIKRKNGAKVFYLRGVGIKVEYDFPFDSQKANSMKITAMKTSDKINQVALVTASFPTSTADIYVGDLAAS